MSTIDKQSKLGTHNLERASHFTWPPKDGILASIMHPRVTLNLNHIVRTTPQNSKVSIYATTQGVDQTIIKFLDKLATAMEPGANYNPILVQACRLLGDHDKALLAGKNTTHPEPRSEPSGKFVILGIYNMIQNKALEVGIKMPDWTDPRLLQSELRQTSSSMPLGPNIHDHRQGLFSGNHITASGDVYYQIQSPELIQTCLRIASRICTTTAESAGRWINHLDARHQSEAIALLNECGFTYEAPKWIIGQDQKLAWRLFGEIKPGQ